MKRVLACLLLLAFVGHARLHLAGLQLVGWSSMIVAFSQDAPLSEAIEKTFDGQNPCALCNLVSDALAEPDEEFSSPAPVSAPLLMAMRNDAWAPHLLILHNLVPASGALCSIERARPPLPPPRGIC